jgi:hypothetical protein
MTSCAGGRWWSIFVASSSGSAHVDFDEWRVDDVGTSSSAISIPAGVDDPRSARVL